ncbi:hypothetical protein P7K49_008376, partial [Saguinus oedipus]
GKWPRASRRAPSAASGQRTELGGCVRGHPASAGHHRPALAPCTLSVAYLLPLIRFTPLGERS